jgi:hypothetical protein
MLRRRYESIIKNQLPAAVDLDSPESASFIRIEVPEVYPPVLLSI